MSFSVTIVADTLEQVQAQALAFAGVQTAKAAAAPKSTKVPQKGAEKTEPAQATLPAIEEPLPTIDGSAVSTGTAGKTASTSTSEPVSTPDAPGAVEAVAAAAASSARVEQIRALLTPLLRDPDHAPKVAELTARFGATKLSKIPTEQLAEALVAAQALAAEVAVS